MAGTSVHHTIGVGPALEKARRIRGLTLEEAARDTRLRVAQLIALEAEDFAALPSDAVVRGSLRTYAQFLGLDPAKVVNAYARHVDDGPPPPPPEGLGRIERAIAATRIRDNQRFLVVGAATIAALLLLFGLVARDRGAPVPATIDTTGPPAVPLEQTIEAVIVAQRPVELTATIDGAPEAHQMRDGETLSFSAIDELTLSATDGGAIQVTVAGQDLGQPGTAGEPWTRTFTAPSFGPPSVSPPTTAASP